MKVLFILPSLQLGGAERVFSFLSQQLNPKYFEVRLLVVGYEKEAKFKFAPDTTVFLNKSRVLYGFAGIVLNIKKFKPAVVISTIFHLNIFMGVLTFFFHQTKFIGREASVYSDMKNFDTNRLPFSDLLVSFFYPRLHAIVCQSTDMKNDLMKHFGLKEQKLVVINNPITQLPKSITDKSLGKNLKFITIGRINPEKGHLRILTVLSQLQYSFEYLIIGDGPNKAKVLEKANELGLASRLIFISSTTEPAAYFGEMDFFLQGSYVEGFPNAVLESCTFGIPVIAFDVPGGTKEIIKNGENGFLVNSELEMVELLQDIDKLRTFTRTNVSKFTIDSFHQEKIVERYENLFMEIIKS